MRLLLLLIQIFFGFSVQENVELGTSLIKFDISFPVQTLETVKSELDGDVSDKGAYSFFITIIYLNFNFMSWGPI